ncbi:MAG: TRAP transporter substrate-binding protein [Rhodobacteraceae bacterium]|nr:TRAP transporter substrate-binding protein [Paracoccaceae bacterium]
MSGIWKALALAGLVGGGATAPVGAQEVTLRLHSFLSATSYPHALFFDPWCERIREQSQGRMVCQIFPSMQLGGAPGDLINQTRDGIVDLAYGNPGYSPGSYVAAEVFELPFMFSDLHNAARAMYDYLHEHAGSEFDGVRILAAAPADFPIMMTIEQPVRTIDDLQGLSLRSAGRYGGLTLGALGALPVQMPAGEITESLNRGVLDGVFLPWSAVSLLHLDGIINHYTEFAPHQPRLYTSMQTFTMSQATYDRLPPDLQAVIDANTGPEVSAQLADAFASTAVREREQVIAAGRDVYVLPDAEFEVWRARAQSVVDTWLADANAKGLDGQALLDAARAAIAARNG